MQIEATSPAKRLKLIAIIFFVLVYTAFLFYKIAKYNLFYYMHDMFSVMNASCGWMHGHPLWWDNRYGFTPSIHFSFMAPLFSPFIILWGGKGLFIFHAVIYFFAFWFALRSATDRNGLMLILATLLVFLISPYAFWLFDDITYGWHIELMLLPSAVFFALALISKKRWLIILCALLLVFTKEDGIVMACCIHLLYRLSLNPGQKINRKKILLIGLGWAILFISALFLVKFFRNFEETRLEAALREFHEDSRFFNAAYFRKISWQFLLLFFPLMAFCFYILSRQNFLKLILLTMPLIITGVISGLWYSGDVRLSVSWAPRFVEIMGVMLAGTIILLAHQKWKTNRKTFAMLVMLTIILQGFALAAAKDYNLFAEIKKAVQKIYPGNITATDAAIIKSIAEKTPADFNVAVPFEYFRAFEKNDFTWLGYYDYAPKKNPDLIIFGDTSRFSKYRYDYETYRVEKEGKFFVLWKKEGSSF